MSANGKNDGAIAYMAGHSVAANLIMLLCLVGGLFAVRHITQEVFPDIVPDQVIVTVPYPGASPSEVERGIVLAVEEAVRGLDSVDKVTSTASEGSGRVVVEMVEGGDLQKLAQDVRNEVDRITTLPEDAEEPRVEILSRRREVIDLLVYGDAEEIVLREIAEQVRERLLQDPNITQIDLSGVRSPEIRIEISQENLRRHGLTLAQVAERLRQASVEIPAGGIKTQGGEILVRVKERRDWGWQFARTPILSAADGTQLLLRDIATVTDGLEEVDAYASFNGKPAVKINVYRVGEQTPTQVSQAVRDNLEILRSILPPGIHADIRRDLADVYRQRLELLLKNGAMGLVLVLVLLGLFLEVRLAFWVMMGIPISFTGTLLLMPLMGVSLNMVTLFAFIIALGIVVDDAIVVGENIHGKIQKGIPFRKAAAEGASEVGMPVVFSILTNMVTFLPLYFIPGLMGKIFKMVPVIVCTAFAVSLLESLFVLPAHLGHGKPARRREGTLSHWFLGLQQAFSRAFLRWVHRRYRRFLIGVLRWRYISFSCGVAVLVLSFAFAMSGRLGFELFPKVESDFARAELLFPYGTAVQRTEEAMVRLVDAARRVAGETGRADELVEGIYAEVGEEGSHHLVVRVYLAPPEIREGILGTDAFTRRWRELVGTIPGVETLKYESDSGGPGGGASLTVEMSHRDLDTLDQASRELARELGSFPLASDIDDGFRPGKRQIDFTMTPEGRSLGLSAEDVARQVRNAFYGAEVLRQQRGRDEVKVMIRLPKRDRESAHVVEELVLRTPNGAEILLREAAAATPGRAYTTIERRDGKRIVQVTAEITPRARAGEIVEVLREKNLPELARRYPGLGYGFEGRNAEQRKSLGSLKGNFVLALLAIYGLLAMAFRSYIQPFIVMSAIPFGIVGAVAGHLLMGYSLGVVSMMGIVALAGVIVNDSLVMVDFANHKRARRCLPGTAILGAAVERFRPILLTTVTTFGGLMPMIFETSRQAKFLIPMAISLGFGILFSTAITLVLVPCLYLIVEDLRILLGMGREEYECAAPGLSSETAPERN